RNDASMTGQVMIYGGKFYFKWMFHKLHLQMSDYVQHLGCSSVSVASGVTYLMRLLSDEIRNTLRSSAARL
ncbi:hypothetical protein, partial [Escherichia coli]|uniref:hypothetical protein n=1 Tax=Escherichia coli TaxID=562 RepID=UPI0030189EF8